MSGQAEAKIHPAHPPQSHPDRSETDGSRTFPMDTDATRFPPDVENRHVGASSTDRSTMGPPTFTVRPSGQSELVGLLTVRAGVPVSDTLELASAMLVSACATTRLVAMDYRGEQSGSLWSTVYLLEVVATLVDASLQAHDVYS
ncbi:DUF3077 domain-containing protein [Thiocystis violacea]|uniref:DUF3077 domain-containing protein n=1 Tax=Thiocystis violacea TaxID=13725 RepID=UPI001906D78B|nr:DUF3077 domain-containing protein [Thiocystis violacea]MBK1717290.1 hypothetical protein [Thiocystis violacea]